MWAMMPRLRTLVSSKPAAGFLAMTNLKPKSPQRHRDTEKTERENYTLPLVFSVSLCLCGDPCLLLRLPREVGEGLVGLGHLDGVLALGHRLALAAVGGHQLV